MDQSAGAYAGLAAQRAGAAARRGVDALLSLVYPPHCLACGASTASPHGLCGPCWRDLQLIARPFCERLGTPFAQDLGPGLLSPAAIAHPPAFGRARGVAIFRDGPARRLVHRLKYGDRLEVAQLMGGLMAQAAGDLIADRPVLVPLPLHRRRLWSRQYNQAALLATAMGRRLGLESAPGLLERVKATAPQVGMSRAQRALNVQGAFKVPVGASVKGRALVLVDDVLTTGSTANAAARALLRAGAARVDLAVFALVAAEATIAI